MSIEKIKENAKSFWNWLWNSEYWLSYLVFLAIVFIIVKFVFLPLLGLIFGTSLPLAIVESSSMDHNSLGASREICGTNLQENKFLNSEEYWSTCGNWYEQNTNITQSEFESFKMSKGFRKGDLIIIFGKNLEDIKIGDILIFNGGRAHPIIHRVVSLNPLATKGDHNSGQLPEEKDISESQIVGVATAKIPYIGWIKLFFAEIWRSFRG